MSAVVACVIVATLLASPASAAYQRISGEGSSWSAGFIDAMRVNVKQFGITVDYNPSGSSAGRKNWLNGTVDFAASDIPFQFQPEDGSAPEKPAAGSYAYIPVTAGGTSFIYNLKINGQRVTNLRLSGENIAKIFTAKIAKWNDPAIAADNPGLTMPDRAIVPVVRSDGSGSSAQFTRWMIRQYGPIWQDFCERSGRAPKCGYTSYYPTVKGMIGQSGDLGVTGYVTQNFAEGSIGYVNYSYAIGAQFPVAKVLNAAGFYTEPTPENVAVSLLKARINTDEGSADYLTQILDDVYTDNDARSYQLSSYSYFILPTTVRGQFNTDKGKTLGAFTYYSMCQGQQQSASLGYSPMPINLVQASFDQIRKIPGVVVEDIDIRQCKNPTFSTDGSNTLANNAPQPQACDKQGSTQCATGTGGAKRTSTRVRSGSTGGSGSGSSGSAATGSSSGSGRTGTTSARGGGSATSGSSGGGSSSSGATSVDGGQANGDPAVSGVTSDGIALGDPTVDGEPLDVTGATDGTSGDVAMADGASEVVASTSVLSGDAGWSSAQTLVILVVLLLLGLVVAPPIVWQRLSTREARATAVDRAER